MSFRLSCDETSAGGRRDAARLARTPNDPGVAIRQVHRDRRSFGQDGLPSANVGSLPIGLSVRSAGCFCSPVAMSTRNPYLFREELDYAFFQIESSPRSAPIHEEEGYGYYKLVLPGTRHWLLYEYHEDADVAVVMTVWSPRRGDRPKLPK